MIEMTTKIKGGVPQIHVLCAVHQETKLPSLCVRLCNTLVKQTHVFSLYSMALSGTVEKNGVSA